MSLYKINSIQQLNYNNLNEAYIGKSANLEKAEKVLDKLRKRLIPLYSNCDFPKLLGKYTKSEELQIFRDCIKKEFGFTGFSLFLYYSLEPNAFTFCAHGFIDKLVPLTRSLQKKDKRLIFNKEDNIGIVTFISSSMIFNKSFTTKELMGIILHEIGHNFEVSILNMTTPIRFVQLVDRIIEDIRRNSSIINITSNIFFNSSLFQKFLNFIDNKFTKNNSAISEIMFSIFVTYIMFFNSVVRLLPGGILNPKDIILHIFNLITGNTSEKLADTFAVYYGYGPELTSGLNKMNGIMKIYSITYSQFSPTEILADLIKESSNIPIFGNMLGLYDFFIFEYFGLTDVHLPADSRTKNIINVLQKEFDDPQLDKATRNQVKKDLQKLNQQFKELSKVEIPNDKRTEYEKTKAICVGIKHSILTNKYSDILDIIIQNTYGGIKSIKKGIDKVLQSSNEQSILTCYGNQLTLTEALEQDKLFEYTVSACYGNEISFDDIYKYRKEYDYIGKQIMMEAETTVINHDSQPGNQTSQTNTQNFEEYLKTTKSNGEDFNTTKQSLQAAVDRMRKLESEKARATAEDKGKIAVMINQLKQAIAFMKRQMLGAKDKVADWWGNKEKGYNNAKRNYETIQKTNNSSTVANTQSKPSPQGSVSTTQSQPNDGNVKA